MTDARLELSSPPSDVDDVHDWLEDVWKRHPEVDGEARFAFETALIELITNSLRHGRTASDIRCTVELDITDTSLTALLTDTGGPVKLPAEPWVMPDDEAEGGRGLALIHLLTDSLEYRRAGDRNVWTVRRNTHA
ncbi:ATP-binding protein [Antribacter sp. KLBMP9083]|uniref:ATP-binding protein n=1 Tax=Antribacter soli TaxID=2910976 RepID=A0AA41QCT7_9MICO|nr:ATP-binding protein [Antribacter soli]MCF4121090.1 ATP-binding protein [Antribacter soli]